MNGTREIGAQKKWMCERDQINATRPSYKKIEPQSFVYRVIKMKQEKKLLFCFTWKKDIKHGWRKRVKTNGNPVNLSLWVIHGVNAIQLLFIFGSDHFESHSIIGFPTFACFRAHKFPFQKNKKLYKVEGIVVDKYVVFMRTSHSIHYDPMWKAHTHTQNVTKKVSTSMRTERQKENFSLNLVFVARFGWLSIEFSLYCFKI